MSVSTDVSIVPTAIGALGAAARRAGPAVLAHDARRALARAPRVVALPGDAGRRAHLRHAPAPLAEQDESEPRPPRPGAYGCLPARRAPASKSISLPLLSRSFPRLGRRGSPAVWKGSASAAGAAAEALLTRSARPDGSTPASRATPAQAVPLSLCGCTARRLNSAACFGHGFPVVRLRPPATAMVPKRESTCQRIRGRFRFTSRRIDAASTRSVRFRIPS